MRQTWSFRAFVYTSECATVSNFFLPVRSNKLLASPSIQANKVLPSSFEAAYVDNCNILDASLTSEESRAQKVSRVIMTVQELEK